MINKARLKTYLYFLFYVFGCTIFAIILRWKIIKKIILNGNIDFSLISLQYAENTGAAFSIFPNGRLFLIILAIIFIISIFGYVFMKYKDIRFMEMLSLALILSGVFLNTFERIQYGWVIDYIKLNFINFPIFNVADIFISLGAFLLIVFLLKK